jgi:hypothetical protein
MTEFLGHSQGTINGHLAIEKLSMAQRIQLSVFSVGTASWHLPKGLGRFVNIVDPNDLVVNLTGGRAISESEYALGRGATHPHDARRGSFTLPRLTLERHQRWPGGSDSNRRP